MRDERSLPEMQQKQRRPRPRHGVHPNASSSSASVASADVSKSRGLSHRSASLAARVPSSRDRIPDRMISPSRRRSMDDDGNNVVGAPAAGRRSLPAASNGLVRPDPRYTPESAREEAILRAKEGRVSGAHPRASQQSPKRSMSVPSHTSGGMQQQQQQQQQQSVRRRASADVDTQIDQQARLARRRSSRPVQVPEAIQESESYQNSDLVAMRNQFSFRTASMASGCDGVSVMTMESAKTGVVQALSGLNDHLPLAEGGANKEGEQLRLSPLTVGGESSSNVGGMEMYQYPGARRSRRRLRDTSSPANASPDASVCGDDSSTVAAGQILKSLLWFKFHAPKCVFEDIVTKNILYETRRRSMEHSLNLSSNFASRRGSDLKSVYSTSRKGSDLMSVTSGDGYMSEAGFETLEDLVIGRGRIASVTSRSRRSSDLLSKLNSLDSTDEEYDSPDVSGTLTLPHSTRRESALLFVDISGFTKLSTMLDVEELSKAINSYFELIVHEITVYGGDILKFAGDALFAEWSTSGNSYDLAECTKAAALCGASIVRKASGFKVYGSKGKGSKKKQVSAGSNIRVRVATLNVHCGLGVGPLVGLHVGNVGATHIGQMQVESRREYLFLGTCIDQVAKAEDIAQKGELVSSPEAIEILSRSCDMPESLLSSEGPAIIAFCSECYVQPRKPSLILSDSKAAASQDEERKEDGDLDNLRLRCRGLAEPTLSDMRDQLGLYVHPVVRGDLSALTSKRLSAAGHRAEAELRNVYVIFVCPKISAKVSGNSADDNNLFSALSDIMMVTMRALDRYQGQLRQFIVDDKGVVLIGTFGLRGSTFPNLIGEYALPATLAISANLKSELGVETSVGATFGKVYCGVVGGVKRHEFAVLGPSVNLAARLMASKENPGILVDATVREQGKNAFVFKKCSKIQAKGYADLVPTFQPLSAIRHKKIGSVGVVGRESEEKIFIDLTRNILECSPLPTKMVVLGGEPGVGKTAMMNHATEKVRKFCALYHKHLCLCRTFCRNDEELVPFSAFRGIFLYAIREYCLFDGTISVHRRRQSLESLKNTVQRRRSLGQEDNEHGGNATESGIPYLEKMRWVCDDLGYEEEYADIVGSKLLDVEGADHNTTTVNGEVPTLDVIVEFLAQAFLRFTLHAGIVFVTVDDMQWMDTLSWAVIRSLFDQGDDLLVLCTIRENENVAKSRLAEAKKWGQSDDRKRFRHIPVKPLKLKDMAYIIARVLGQEETLIDEEFCEELHERSGGGVPIFCVEILDHVRRNLLYEIDSEGIVRSRLGMGGDKTKYGGGSSILDELFLQRFDALDVHVRKVLQSCAVLGMEFKLSDVIQVNPDFVDDRETLQTAIDAAITDRILVDIDKLADDDGSIQSDSITKYSGSNSGIHSRSTSTSQDGYYRFATTMWRESVLKTMLTDRQMELHKNIAMSMEAEGITDATDTKTLLKLFEHWKACTDFGKAAPLALIIGARLEEFESSQQSLDLYCEVLKMWRTDTKNNVSLETLGAWYEPSMSSKALEYTVKLKTRIGKCLCDMGELDKGALGYRDGYLLMTKLPASPGVDRNLLFPIISGLWQSIPWDKVMSKEDCDFKLETELVNRFIKESREQGDPTHVCRALAMQASLYARTSDFENALVAQRDLEKIYNFREHSPGIVNEYGSDFAAISYGNSVQWYEMIGDRTSALKQIEFVVRKMVPKFPPIAVHDLFSVLFPISMVMKDLGFGREAKDLLKKYVLERFSTLGLSSSTFWYPLYKPIKILLELVILDDSGATKDDIQLKALDAIEKWVLQAGRLSPISALERYGRVIRGEICLRLAKRKSNGHPSQFRLIEKGTKNALDALKSMRKDGSYAYMMRSAYFIYQELKDMQNVFDQAAQESLQRPMLQEEVQRRM